LLALGGTIASASAEVGEGVVPTLKGREILERIPPFAGVAEVDVVDLATIASYALTLSALTSLAERVTAAIADDFDGVVITQGTDTIEETAYGLALMLRRDIPVAITGAMTPAQDAHSDGPRNLAAAILVAAHARTAALGPVVVANDLIHVARWATKIHTSNVATFQSPQSGPVGEVVEGGVHVWFHPAYEDHVGLPSGEVPTVELMRLYPDCGDAALRAIVASRPAGVVLEGTGGGHIPPPLLPALQVAIDNKIAIVLATRCATGRVLERTYDLPGSEMDLLRRGAIPAGILSGTKARLRLAIGLARGLTPDALFPV
jgi:L-asparaginase